MIMIMFLKKMLNGLFKFYKSIFIFKILNLFRLFFKFLNLTNYLITSEKSENTEFPKTPKNQILEKRKKNFKKSTNFLGFSIFPPLKCGKMWEENLCFLLHKSFGKIYFFLSFTP